MASTPKIATAAARRLPVEAGGGDVVIIGAGLAGLFTALRLAPMPVTVVAAAPLGEGASSVWAQGGIAAAVGEGDSPETHAADTIAAGAGTVDPDIAHMVASEAGERIRDLLRYGVPFDRDLEGHFVLSREAAHTKKRVVRVSGDRAGAAIMQALIAAVRGTPSITVLEGYEAVDLVVEESRVAAVRVIASESPSEVLELRPTRAVVLATGGVGALYAVTTNPAYACGVGIAMAARAGAKIADAELVQFHPTALDLQLDPAPLASEALRGEGAILVNRAGERFMLKVHPDAELAPRDIVARAVFAEVTAGRGAFLDCRQSIGARFPTAFPTVYAHAKAAGLDPVTDLLPVAPAEHYHMGGVATDAHGRSTVAGLWAVGEVASTGLHGANRLASNSLLEAVVFGARVADSIKATTLPPRTLMLGPAPARPLRLLAPETRQDLIGDLRRTMSECVGVVRSGASLLSALHRLEGIRNEAAGDPHVSAMAETARFVAGMALLRTESRGGHFRSDFPAPDPKLARRVALTTQELEVALARHEARPPRALKRAAAG